MIRTILFLVSFQLALSAKYNPEKRLIRWLMIDYDKRSRPVANHSQPVTVKYGFKLSEIQGVDERNNKLELFAWQSMQWRDEYLSWRPKNFDNISEITIPSKYVWQPDFIQENNAKDFYNKQYQEYFHVIVNHDGIVTAAPAGQLTTVCSFNLFYFPFDKHTCKVVISSWTYTCDEVDIKSNLTEIDLGFFKPNGEWTLEYTDVTNIETKTNRDYKYCSVYIHLTLKRKPLYYILVILLPCVILSLVSVFTFIIPPESSERIMMSMTSLLAFVLFLTALNNILPRNSDQAPMLVSYITVIVIAMWIALIISIFLVKVYFKDQPSKENIPDQNGNRGLLSNFKSVGELVKEKKRDIADWMDITLFWVFTIGLGVATIVIFVIIPPKD
ncbi:DgyrCDS3336 [Dimorphilus gyrociliatus]|uniref:DgyrCDS3336 n=1 Tax=Dimorphilus gyrociliatus TaxID=2664684 RepID=A0A7I8VCW7_9ANNE|nr:DgyrCDS3336 [Dimorphilus gyrociliatus]